MSGCGQGTQALRLARRGVCRHGRRPFPAALLGRFASACPPQTGAPWSSSKAASKTSTRCFGGRRFDLVCAHGVLMYLADRRAAITQLARRVAGADGRLSFTVRNGHALGDAAGAAR